MKGMSAKNKIVMLVIAWLVLSVAMFLFFFKLLDGANQATLDSMSEERRNLVLLQAQDQSYKQAEADLQELAQKPYQPENFFTSDIALVDEIQTLEDLSAKYNVQMSLSGVAGTINSLGAANTVTSLAIVPYSVSLTGNFVNVVNFIETMEHLSFVTNITSLNINPADQNNVSANLSANFYLRK